jgi:uncharacterized protein YbjQ (UPF0145 family)
VTDDSGSDLERARAESLARLERGELPLEAERRLQALRDRPDFFTSDLSVDEIALAGDLGVRPVSQVMGSCVYHVGQPLNFYWGQPGDGYIQTVPVLEQAWNEARGTAVDRLREEAAQCGADAVVGVHIQRAEREFVASSVEFVMLGTAVRVPGAKRSEKPVVTGLSGSEYWQLLRAGFTPRGLVMHTSVVQAILDPDLQWAMTQGALGPFGSNLDLPNYGRGVEAAVAEARAEMGDAAAGLKANGIVGFHVDWRLDTIDVQNFFGGGSGIFGMAAGGGGGAVLGSTGGRGQWGFASLPQDRKDLIVTVHALGTAVVRDASRARSEGLKILPVRNLQAEGSA